MKSKLLSALLVSASLLASGSGYAIGAIGGGMLGESAAKPAATAPKKAKKAKKANKSKAAPVGPANAAQRNNGPS